MTEDTKSIEPKGIASSLLITCNASLFHKIDIAMVKNRTDSLEANLEVNAPAKYWPGVAYTSEQGNGASLAADDLANIPVGVTDTSKGQQQAIVGTHTLEAIATAKKTQKRGQAQHLAYDAQAKRVSRRLLLAERAKLLTVSCPITGIVSLLQIPSIPACSLIWDSPLSDLANCRGMAQQGIDYLKQLDTQVLSGLLIVLSDAYSLFKFQPYDSGVQKNAILRTAGKELGRRPVKSALLAG